MHDGKRIAITHTPSQYDAIILGAGAAGLMCALTAGQRGKRVLLLDHAEKIGKKILISGGGRCNFTNTGCVPDRFISQNPHFAKSALSRYTSADFIALVEKYKIPYHEKTLGQQFCDGSAREIVAMLRTECEIGNVDIRVNTQITGVTKSNDFRVQTSQGVFTAPHLGVATGGPAIPKMGATGFAYTLARQFGLKLIEPRPALVPLTVTGDLLSLCQSLAGVATEAIVSFGARQFREAILFTHRGLSGPAILQISSYLPAQLSGNVAITLNMAPDINVSDFFKDRKRTRPKAELQTLFSELVPQRLAAALAPHASTLANMPDRTLELAAKRIQSWALSPTGSEGFAKAEVTVGGVDTAGLSSKTMMAKNTPGLYFIGEAVDVTGWLGGYNFQWAWASGWCAGMAIAEQ
jgi:predicted Rossmann fold flavoprotein